MRGVIVSGKAFDICGALAQRTHGTVVAHHGERSDNLAQWHFEGGEVGTFLRIAEEAVKHLFYLYKIGLDFLGNLPDQEFFLSLPRHFIEFRHFRSGHRRVFSDTAVNPLDHNVDLMRKIATKALEVFLGILREQDCRRDFHGQRVGVTRRLFCQPAGGSGNGLCKAAIVGLPKLVNRSGQGGGMLLELWQGLRGAGTEFVPCFFGGGDDFAQTAANRFLRGRGAGI